MLGEPTQSATELSCDQAIFTSIRTPMGEGYRIIAASRGLRPDEKQAITRSSPSHESLCWSPAEEENLPGRLAAAFYALPTGRLCAALSQYAGEEHTGRGGHRVYTHNVIFDAADFPGASFNAFVVLRAMVDAGLTEPKLKPPPTLPPLSLELGELPTENPFDLPETFPEAEIPPFDGCEDGDEDFWGALGTPWRRHVLEAILERHNVVVNLTERWTECAEALLLGVPGPLRVDISFSAGIKYSVGRRHTMSLIHDETGATQTRVSGRDVELVDPTDARQTPKETASHWLRFIERHWAKQDLVGLSRRTSQAFAQVDAAGRDQIAQGFEEIDSLPTSTTDNLLKILAQHLPTTEAEGQSHTLIERTSAAGHILARRFHEMAWSEANIFWPHVAALHKESTTAMRLVKPLIQALLESAAQAHPLVAAEATLDVFRNDSGKSNDLDSTRDKVLQQLLDWLDTATETQRSRPCGTKESLETVLGEWCRIQPDHPTVQRIHQHLSSVASTGTAS